jgi:hypothetical protein
MEDIEALVFMKDGTVRNLTVYAVGWPVIGWPVIGYSIDVPIDECNSREAEVVRDGDYFREI